MSDVPGSIEVRVEMVAARTAEELSLALSVSLLLMAAAGAAGRGMAGINRNIRHASELALIFQKETELPEGPGVQHPPHLLWRSNATPDALQVLHGDGGFGLPGAVDDGPAYLVVLVSNPAAFLSRKAFEHTVGLGMGLELPLEFSPLLAVVVADEARLLSPEEYAIGKSSELGQAEVNPYNTLRLKSRSRGHLYRDMEIPISVGPDQIRPAVLQAEIGPVPRGDMEGKLKRVAFEVKDEDIPGKAVLWGLEAGHRTVGREGPAPSPPGPVGFSGLVHGRGEAESKEAREFPLCLGIATPMESLPARHPCFPTPLQPPGDTTGELSLVSCQGLGLGCVGQLQPDGKAHGNILHGGLN